MNYNSKDVELATLAGGCFWCTEAIFNKIQGIKSILPGYTGGRIKNPSYEQVCSGNTGHAEAVQIQFDPKIISFEKILDIFWNTHDPTTLNRQGNDVGTQYRSAIFYHNNRQKEIAEKSKNVLNEKQVYRNPVVTEITSFNDFFAAEEYHKNYYEKNSNEPYCSFVISPKIRKLSQKYGDEIKK